MTEPFLQVCQLIENLGRWYFTLGPWHSWTIKLTDAKNYKFIISSNNHMSGYASRPTISAVILLSGHYSKFVVSLTHQTSKLTPRSTPLLNYQVGGLLLSGPSSHSINQITRNTSLFFVSPINRASRWRHGDSIVSSNYLLGKLTSRPPILPSSLVDRLP